MDHQTLQVKAALQVLKPAPEVFEAIVDPAKMSNYFISQGSGRMEEDRQLTWRFPEFNMEIPVRVGKIEKDQYISYYWDGEGKELLVEIMLTPAPADDQATVVTITEKRMDNDEAGIKWLKGNTEGWANFLACLKAWLEYGINLRKGAFDFRKGEF